MTRFATILATPAALSLAKSGVTVSIAHAPRTEAVAETAAN